MRAGFARCCRSPGRTLIEYQARCLAAAGAAPLVVLVERVPVALNDAFERLRGEGIAVVPVSDGNEAASRFEAGSQLILLGDGIVARHGRPRAAGRAKPMRAILTVPDDEAHAEFERIDGAAALGRAGAGRFQHARSDRRDARRLGPAIDPAAAGDPIRRAA